MRDIRKAVRKRKKALQLEAEQPGTGMTAEPTPVTAVTQGDLFASAADHPALQLLEASDPDSLSPREALALLYQLRATLR